jgi:hypothetical protein
MLDTGYFLVRPNDALRKRLESVDAETVSLLDETRLWAKRLDRAVGEAFLANHMAEIKLMHLADLLDDLNDMMSDTSFFEELLGPPPYTTATFDRWWRIEHLGDNIMETFDGYADHLAPDVFEQLAPDGSADEWLDLVARKKES